MSEDDNISEGLDLVLSGQPLQIDCENCDDVGFAPGGKLPKGWRYVTVSPALMKTLDEVDSKSLIICAICYGLLAKILKKLPAPGSPV